MLTRMPICFGSGDKYLVTVDGIEVEVLEGELMSLLFKVTLFLIRMMISYLL